MSDAGAGDDDACRPLRYGCAVHRRTPRCLRPAMISSRRIANQRVIRGSCLS